MIFYSFFLLSAFILGSVQCLYFHIGETERKCFIEEIPDETTVVCKLHNNSHIAYLVFVY